MKCPDCIHYEVCQSRITYDENYGDSTSFETRCGDFKDKSKFIELPCKVGDRVYGIKEHWFLPCKNKHYTRVVYSMTRLKRKDPYRTFFEVYEKNATKYDVKRIGKTAFLTKEEAEQSLKELNSK